MAKGLAVCCSVQHQPAYRLKDGTSSSAQLSCPSSPLSLIWREIHMYFCISCLPQIGGCTGHLVAAGGTPSSSRQLMCCPRRLNPPWAKAFAMARTYFQHGSVHGKVWRKKQPQPQPSWWEDAVGLPLMLAPPSPGPLGLLSSPPAAFPSPLKCKG